MVRPARPHAGYRLTVEDDGVGFDPGSEIQPGHMGLAAMRDRAELSGGRLAIVPGLGGGTVIEAWVPENDQADGSVVS